LNKTKKIPLILFYDFTFDSFEDLMKRLIKNSFTIIM